MAENIDELGAVRWGATGLWRFCKRVRRRPEIRGYKKKRCYMKSCKINKVKVTKALNRNKKEGVIKKPYRKKNIEQKKETRMDKKFDQQ